jgi:predicted DNA-binding transcriptional regulator YafY
VPRPRRQADSASAQSARQGTSRRAPEAGWPHVAGSRIVESNLKLRIDYGDEQGQNTSRTIWPFALAYYLEATVISAWCELRNDFRHFRADRVRSLAMLDEGFPVPGRTLTADWVKRFSRDVTPDGVLTTR